jgi:hypothetical protein
VPSTEESPDPAVDVRNTLIAQVQARAALRVRAGAPAARSQDFLYDEDGLPR